MKYNSYTIEKLYGARRGAIPSFIAPQLATLVKEPPTGDDWLHELKFDGYRMLCHIDRDQVRFLSRNGKDWTGKFPNLTLGVKALPAKSAIIDGEVVIFERDGRPSFQKLQHAIGSGGNTRFSFVAFDLIYLDGLDLTRVALDDRKRVLKALFEGIPASGPLRYSDHVEGNGQLFYDHACKTGIEGVVSKLRTSRYDSAPQSELAKGKMQQATRVCHCRVHIVDKGSAWIRLIDSRRVRSGHIGVRGPRGYWLQREATR